MNYHHPLPKALQYRYLLGSVRKKKRRSPWHKEDAEKTKLAELVSRAFNLSPVKARQALQLLTPEQIESIKAGSVEGGY
jgi:hypothetical protein